MDDVRPLHERRRRWWCAAIAVALLASANLFIGLDGDRIDSDDEARYGVTAFEMLETGDWIHATYAHVAEYWNLKPPLGTWLVALSYRAFGTSAWAMRLPSALSALACILLVMWYARRVHGDAVAVIAGVALATAFPFINRHGGRAGDLDSQLALLSAIAVIAPAAIASTIAAAWISALALGLGFLLKSFAVLPAALTIVAHQMLIGRERRIPLRRWILPLVVATAMIAWWAIERVRRDGSCEFIVRMVREDLVDRGARGVDDRGRRWTLWYYVGYLLDRFCPWCVLALLLPTQRLLARLRGGLPPPRAAGSRLEWSWFAVPFVLFTVARTQCRWYLIPMLPPLALRAAVAVRTLWPGASAPMRALLAGGAIASIVIGEVRIVRQVHEDHDLDASDALRQVARDPRWHGARIRCEIEPSNADQFIIEVLARMRVVASDEPADLALTAPTAPTAGGDGRDLVASDRRHVIRAVRTP